MPTIGEVYNPLIKAALAGDRETGDRLLRESGQAIFERHPTRCRNVEDGIEAAKRNLDYFCQYYDEATAHTVKEFYGLGAGMRLLDGTKV